MTRASVSLLAGMLLFCVHSTWGAEKLRETIYVQAIRATDVGEPGSPTWKRIGPKFSRTLSPVYRWEHYWEIDRQVVVVTAVKVSRVALPPHRELRLRLLPDSRMDVQLFAKGELRRKLIRRADDEMSIFHGDDGTKDGWFVVVRRDKPTLE